MSQSFWESRYRSRDMPWEKGAPSPGLVDFLAAHRELGRGTVCVPGCGTGHDVRAWAQAGFPAFGYDIAPSAIRLATERARTVKLTTRDPSKRTRLEQGTEMSPLTPSDGERVPFRAGEGKPDDPPNSRGSGCLRPSAQFQIADFLTAPPPFRFDWVFEHTLFCAIQPGERDAYLHALLRWLKPDGQYLAVNYLIPDRDGPPFGTTRDELWQRFTPHFDLTQEWVPRSYPNRTGLELMLWWRRSAPIRKSRARARRSD